MCLLVAHTMRSIGKSTEEVLAFVKKQCLANGLEEASSSLLFVRPSPDSFTQTNLNALYNRKQ